ncbi:MAG TPA: hypothetical protein VNS58_32205 [Puia sp.]|nr:hypothetical protein [Puia sp.]
MSLYLYQLEDFALSDSGVHLLRNQFNFRTIGYAEIEMATIERSTEIRNAPLTLLFGILLICFSFYQCRWIVELFTNPQEHTIYIESIVLPIIPAFLGVYCTYIALKKGPVLKLEEGKKKHKLRLRSLAKNNLSFEFERYLNKQLGTKLQVDISLS